VTDKPYDPDLPHVEPESAPDIEVRFPKDARVPSTVPTRPPSPSEYEDPKLRVQDPCRFPYRRRLEDLHNDPMQYAPRWGRHVNTRVDGVVERLGAVESALHLLARALDIESGIPALRRGLAKDIAEAMAGYIDPLLQDNALIKRELADVQSRLRITEGEIEMIKRDLARADLSVEGS
jgi:hypothetical protein